MQDRYAATGSTTDATRKAVAQLVYDCGRASHMVYAEQGSGTTALLATAGLAYNFQYDSLALKCQFRLLTGDERWMRTIYSEIEAGRPVLLNAEDSYYGAHAFVLDGLRKQDGYVHVNWGWTGDANGYFDLFNLKTHSAMTQAYGMNPYDFSNAASQVLITGIAPSVAGSHYESFFAMSGEERFYTEGDSLIMYLPDLVNYHYQTFTGLVGVAFEDSVTHHTPIQPFYYTLFGAPPIPSLAGWNEQTIPWYKRTTDNLADGTYFLYLLSWSLQEMNAETDPQFIRFPHRNDGTENYNRWRLVKKNGHITVTKMEPVPEVSAITAPQAATPRISGRYDLQGRQITGHYKGIVIERNAGGVKKYLNK